MPRAATRSAAHIVPRRALAVDGFMHNPSDRKMIAERSPYARGRILTGARHEHFVANEAAEFDQSVWRLDVTPLPVNCGPAEGAALRPAAICTGMGCCCVNVPAVEQTSEGLSTNCRASSRSNSLQLLPAPRLLTIVKRVQSAARTAARFFRRDERALREDPCE
jgi:hypothetical protein